MGGEPCDIQTLQHVEGAQPTRLPRASHGMSTHEQMENTDLDLMIAATSDSIVMVEGEMKEISEETMLEAFKFGHEVIKDMNAMQEELRTAVGKTPREYEKLEFHEGLYNLIKESAAAGIEEITRAHASKEVRAPENKFEDQYETIKGIYEERLKSVISQIKVAQSRIELDPLTLQLIYGSETSIYAEGRANANS